MRLLSNCTNGLLKLKLTQPKLVWLEHRAVLSSSAPGRRRQSGGVKTSVCPTPAGLVSSLSRRPPTRFSVLLTPARAVLHTPVAFSSSSVAASPAPAGPVKTQAEAEDRSPTTVPLEDVKRILGLSHPERWRLAGRPFNLSLLFPLFILKKK